MVKEREMWKMVLYICVMFNLLGAGCEKTATMENQKLTAVKISPTVSPENAAVANYELKPRSEVYLNQGLKYKAAGEYENAIAEFKKSIEAGGDDKEMHRRVAELYILLKKYEDAKTYLKAILKKDEEDAMAHWALAKILVENLGEYEEGLREAIISKKLYGQDGTSHVHDRIIGKAYDGLKDYKNAIKYYKLFLKGSSYVPDSNDYKEAKKRVLELERINSK